MSDLAVRSLRDPFEDGAESPPGERLLEFTGSGAEYFRIWIVHVALTLLTLGVFSAWAKVRSRRYFYGNIRLGDAAFDYTARPIAILRGRILVVAVAAALWFTNLVSLWYYYGALLLLAPLVPWIVVRARSFQLRNSSYCGIPFDFQGGFREAAIWYPLTWFGSVATFGLLWPFRVFGRDRYLVRESLFGNRRFDFTGEPGRYYGIYTLAWLFGFFLMIGTCFALVASVAGSIADPSAGDVDPSSPFYVLAAVAVAASLFYAAYLRTALLNYRWNSTRLGENEFHLSLSFGTMLWLYVSNAAAIVCTFGLFAPFARVRVLRYIVGEFLVVQREDEDAFQAGERRRVGAAGAEAAGEWGLEIGI